MARLGDVCDILDSRRVPITASNRKPGPYPYYGANGVQDYVDGYIFDDELVLVAEDGGYFGSQERPIAYRVSGKCWVNNHAHVLKPKSVVDVDYLCYSLMFRDVSSIVNGATRQKLTQADLRQIEIEIPTAQHQKSIVAQLDGIFSLLSLRKQQLAKLDELVKSRFVEMFGGKDYPMVCLSDVADISSGLTKNANRPSFPVKMPYLRVANVFFNRLDLSDVQEIGLQEKEVEKTLLMKDDLLFVEGNGSPEQIGRVALWNGSIAPISHQNHIIKARFSSSLIIPGFAMYYFMLPAGREQILESAVSTSGLYTLSVGKISNFKLPMPPKDEQEAFMTIVAQVDKSKLAVQQSIDQLETLKKSLMQKYFG